jgi:hypothetical protein
LSATPVAPASFPLRIRKMLGSPEDVALPGRCRSHRALDQQPVLLGGHVTLVPVPPPGLMPGLLGPMARYRKTSA